MNSHVPSSLLDSSSLFSEEELSSLNFERVPSHVAIMMDGNRRWARRRLLPSATGHWRGAERLTNIVKAASELGIKTLTVYSFSTENWRRSQKEIDAIMHLLKVYLAKEREGMVQEGVRLETIGDLTPFPQDVIDEINTTKETTAKGSKIDLVLALNYGGRDEIKRATQSLIADCLQSKISPESITEETIAAYLDTSKWADPDIIIRTSGEYRLSNFLLWQASYAEVFVTDTLWPDFRPHHLLNIIKEYQKRERRNGL